MSSFMTVFKGFAKEKPSEFEDWLSTNGYFYVKTKGQSSPVSNQNSLKILKKKFKSKDSNAINVLMLQKLKIFSFKFGG